LQSAENLCSNQRFLNDPTPAFCSGVLIDDDLVLTAGQCIDTAATCANTRIVFNFYRTSVTGLQTVTTADIFSCHSIIARQRDVVNGRGLDYAIVRLDRVATPRFTPAPVRTSTTPLSLNAGVSVIGSSITFTAPHTGDYVINAGCFGNQACSGSVAWTVVGGSVSTQGSFNFSASNTNSVMQNTVNQDVTIAAGQLITVATCGMAGASHTGDTYLRLFDGATQVAANDDACGGMGSRLTYVAPSATTLQIRAGCYSNAACSGTVAYTIQ
ncbi:trypsin-like serine peptidase, partial [Myxococcus sp. 1LA]